MYGDVRFPPLTERRHMDSFLVVPSMLNRSQQLVSICPQIDDDIFFGTVNNNGQAGAIETALISANAHLIFRKRNIGNIL